MKANRARDTSPEMAVRRMVHGFGLRYRVSARPVPGIRRTADLLFKGPQVAVFIDGCFWHGCPEHSTSFKKNSDFWTAKIARNRKRDIETRVLLEQYGWTVLRYWEHEDPRTVAIDIRNKILAGTHPN